MSEIGAFWLLLPVAAGLSWYFARRGSERVSGQQVDRLRANYFRGLNYLLNEQPDKAIEVFLQIAEVDSDTVETHLALGNLFRRRGEVDRAIRVHQNLIARPTLAPEQKTAALLELGEDYMRAGLLDRAETLFSDLVGIDVRAASALRHLISIYQQERDWPPPDLDLPAGTRLAQGDRPCAPARGRDRRVAGAPDRAVLVRTGRARAQPARRRRCAPLPGRGLRLRIELRARTDHRRAHGARQR